MAWQTDRFVLEPVIGDIIGAIRYHFDPPPSRLYGWWSKWSGRNDEPPDVRAARSYVTARACSSIARHRHRRLLATCACDLIGR
jgi:hypothetical protein